MKSIFSDKAKQPTEKELVKGLSKTFEIWKELEGFTKLCYPAAKSEWKFSGEKFGWGYRISDKKRVLIYLLPRDQFFKVAFVFGEKAMQHILKSDINEFIKAELQNAKPYAEGRGIRIDINDRSMVGDLQKLIEIKVAS